MKLKLLVVLSLFLGDLPSIHAQTNVLVIIADDLGIDSLSAFNQDIDASLPPTPTIDDIQNNGITFTRFYSYSTCSPTRGAIMTGRYSFRTGVVSPDTGGFTLQSNDFTLPEALVASGVISDRLASIGKWHLGPNRFSPNRIGGWPHFSGSLGGGVSDFYSWQKTINGVTSPNHTVYATSDNVDESTAWINQQGASSWFLWLAFNAPHIPHHRPPNDLHDYDSISDDGLNSSRPHYEAMVQAVDTEMARLLSNVDLATTTVIFMGDNGTLRGVVQPPFAITHGKGSVYEGGVRVPLLIYGAAVDSSLVGTSYHQPIHSVDLYSTILELFGVVAGDVVPDELILDSRSFAAVLRGEDFVRDPADIMIQTETETAGRSSTEGDYKYIAFENGSEEFYNVISDLPEENDLLGGDLTDEQQLAFDALRNKLATYVNTPRIYSAYSDEIGGFNTEIGWFDNEGFTLWATPDLVSEPWVEVDDQELLDSGDASILLRDPTPPIGRSFYRVSTP